MDAPRSRASTWSGNQHGLASQAWCASSNTKPYSHGMVGGLPTSGGGMCNAANEAYMNAGAATPPTYHPMGPSSHQHFYQPSTSACPSFTRNYNNHMQASPNLAYLMYQRFNSTQPICMSANNALSKTEPPFRTGSEHLSHLMVSTPSSGIEILNTSSSSSAESSTYYSNHSCGPSFHLPPSTLPYSAPTCPSNPHSSKRLATTTPSQPFLNHHPRGTCSDTGSYSLHHTPLGSLTVSSTTSPTFLEDLNGESESLSSGFEFRGMPGARSAEPLAPFPRHSPVYLHQLSEPVDSSKVLTNMDTEVVDFAATLHEEKAVPRDTPPMLELANTGRMEEYACLDAVLALLDLPIETKTGEPETEDSQSEAMESVPTNEEKQFVKQQFSPHHSEYMEVVGSSSDHLPDVGGDENGTVDDSKRDISFSPAKSDKDKMAPGKKPNYRNPWGKYTYSEIIAQAIESMPNQRATLQQIYDYIIENYEYFREKNIAGYSGGWKNSIRHNLSLHDKFIKCPKTSDSAKSCFWMLNRELKDTYVRKRGGSLDANKATALKKKAAAVRERSSTLSGADAQQHRKKLLACRKEETLKETGTVAAVSTSSSSQSCAPTPPPPLLVSESGNPPSTPPDLAAAQSSLGSTNRTRSLLVEPAVVVESSSSCCWNSPWSASSPSVGGLTEATRRLCLDLARHIFYEEESKRLFSFMQHEQQPVCEATLFSSTASNCMPFVWRRGRTLQN